MLQVMDKVNAFSDQMLLHYSAPNKDLITEIMQFDAEGLSNLTREHLSKYVLVLGQYLVMLQHNENMKTVEYKLATKALEFYLSQEKFARTDVKGKSEKERNIWLVINDPKAQQFHNDALVAEAEKMAISGMVRAVEGLLNALKKELSIRSVE
jgi:hypothetical protein